MGLFNRISDIVSANLNDLVDKCEDPEKLLKQAIREMDESISAATTDAAKVIGNEKRLQKELTRNQEEVAKYEARALRFVEEGNDTAARDALKKKQEFTSIVASQEEQLEGAKGSNETLKQQINAMNAKLDEAKRNLATLTARKKAADIRKQAAASGSLAAAALTDNSAFEKFERMREKVEQAEAEAEALEELAGTPNQSDSLNDNVEDELAALKKRIANS